MAESSRLINLPGYDTAPDVYETAATDDTSTQSGPTSTITAPTSGTEDTSEPSEGDDVSSNDEVSGVISGNRGGVSRRRLHPERARRRFGESSKGVEVKGVDLSDRVDGRRKGLKVRRVRKDDEGEEGLEQRIARLKREVEECRALAEKEKEEVEGEADHEAGEQVDELRDLLASLEAPAPRRKTGVSANPQLNGGSSDQPRNGKASTAEASIPPDEDDDRTFSRIADFDTRLAALEQSLGLSTLDQPSSSTAPIPVLPALAQLDHQLSALTSSTSLTSLEAMGARIAKLRHEAELLASSASAPSPTTTSADEQTSPPPSDLDIEKLHSLYNLLPTLLSLSPTVPATLTRLRTLRTLHTSAANAASDLAELEKQQDGLDAEIKGWKEGLEKVEAAVQVADEANGRNGRVVEGWVRGLEGRMKEL